jgi:hypothetical protein
MNEYPIKIRIGSANAGDYETKTYTDSTFNEAVLALQGTHEDYHRDTGVYVVATYPNTYTETLDRRTGRTTERYAGQPVFGYEAHVYGRGQKYGDSKDAQPSWSSMSTASTEEARMMLGIYDLATRLAEAANTHPRCTGCIAEEAERDERHARIIAETEAKKTAHAAIHVGVGFIGHDGYAPHSHLSEDDNNHKDISCECEHPTHFGKVCRECSKQTPRGMHGTPARCGLTHKAGAK